MREGDFLKPNLSQNPMETRARLCERECVSMRELNTPLGPYLKRRWCVHQRRGKPQRLWSRWRRWGPGAIGPRSAGPRVGPLVPLFGLVLPQRLSSLKIWCTAKSLLEKMFKLFFPKVLKLRKYFWYIFFVKREKCKKNSNVQKTILKISNMQWRKTNKVQRKC